MSSDGFRILVGRNNVQNDILTLKTAKNYDMWLHVQKQAGSHTIIVADNKEITEFGRNDIYVIFEINANLLTKSSGVYSIVDSTDNYISSGNWYTI